MARCGGEGPPLVPQGAQMSVAAEAPFTAFDPAAATLPPGEVNQSILPEVQHQSIAPTADVFVPEAPVSEMVTSPFPLEVLAVARKYGISPGRVEVILSEPSVKALEGQTTRLVEKRLTPARLTEWLASPRGEAWMKQNPGAVAGAFRERAKIGGIGIGVGILGLLGAEEIADIIGLDPVHHAAERFFFVVYSMHGAERLGSTAWGIASARLQGRPFDFMRTSLVRQGERTMLQVTLEARSSFPRALAAAVTSNFVVEGSILRTVANGARSVLLLPVKMIPAMGPGIAASRLVDAALGSALPHDSQARRWISTLAFFMPHAYVSFTKGWGVPFLNKIGFGAVGRAFAAGFALDITTLIVQEAVMGDEAAYQRSVSQRVAQRYFDDQMTQQVKAISDLPWYLELFAWVGAGILYNIRQGANFVAPTAMAEARRMDADPKYEKAVYAEDTRASREIQGAIPKQLLMLLAQGIGSERDTAQFYRTIDVGIFRGEIELDEAAAAVKGLITSLSTDRTMSDQMKGEFLRSMFDDIRSKPGGEAKLNRAMALMQAHGLQQSLATLNFIHLPVNDRFRDIVDEKGRVREGREDAFLNLLDPSRPASQIREELLALRRAALIVRVLEAEGAVRSGLFEAGGAAETERNRLLALAGEVGLTDASGGLAKTDLYFQAAVEWAKMARGDAVRQARLDAYRSDLQLQMMEAASDPDRQLALAKEILILSGARAGIDVVVDREPAVTEAALPTPAQVVVPIRPVAAQLKPTVSGSFGGITVVDETQPRDADVVMPWEDDGICREPMYPWSTPESSQVWIPPAVVPGGAAVFAH